MLKKIYQELVAIRQELKAIRKGNELETSVDISFQEVIQKSHYPEKILESIEEVYRQVRFDAPDLAKRIKNYMLEKERKKGDLPK